MNNQDANISINSPIAIEPEIEPDNHGLWIGSSPNDLVKGLRHVGHQFRALFVKRAIHSLRNKTLVIAQLIIPIGVLIINLLSLKYGPIKPEDSPALQIDLARYSQNYVPFTVQSELSSVSRLAQFFAIAVDSRPNSRAFELNRTDVVGMCNNSRGILDVKIFPTAFKIKHG